jgi:hypothetical protein
MDNILSNVQLKAFSYIATTELNEMEFDVFITISPPGTYEKFKAKNPGEIIETVRSTFNE